MCHFRPDPVTGYPAGEQLRNLASSLLSDSFQQLLPQYSLDPLGLNDTNRLLVMLLYCLNDHIFVSEAAELYF